MSNQMEDVARSLYDIEVEDNSKNDDVPYDFITYELVTKTGGSVRDDHVDGRNRSADVGFNSKDHNFLMIIKEIGMLDRLEEKIKEQEAKK